MSLKQLSFLKEDMIFVTCNGFLYYIYEFKYERWKKYHNAGADHITVSKYPDITKEELMDVMQGVFPQKKTDFMRLCAPKQLGLGDMLDVLKEDYSGYMSDRSIYYAVSDFLSESKIRYKSYLEVKKLLDKAAMLQQDSQQVLVGIKDLCYTIIGRDIFKEEIGIVDGHDCSSYFWIMPVRVIDYTDTNDLDNVAEMSSAEISIEEDDVAQYLAPFLFKHYDDSLEANQKRVDCYWTDDEGHEQTETVSGFEWYLTYNFFTFSSVMDILKDVKATMDALALGKENEFTEALRVKRVTATDKLLYAKDLNEEQIAEYNANRPEKDNTKTELIIDFYRRFIYRMEYMLKVGEEKGYDLISFMGP